MALFDSPRPTGDEEILGSDAATRALVGHGGRERFRRGRLREARLGLRLHLRPDAPPRPRRRRSSGWASSPAIACSKSASAPASTPRCIRATARSPASTSRARCSRRRASASRARASRNVRLLEMDAARPEVRRRHLRHRLRAVSHQRRARSGRGRARDAPRLPSRRPHHHPEPFPQPESACWRSIERAISPFTVHIGFKSDLDLPGVPRAGRAQADLDREGERPADLVARHLRQGMSADDAHRPAALACRRPRVLLPAAVRRPGHDRSRQRRSHLFVRRRPHPRDRRLARAARAFRHDDGPFLEKPPLKFWIVAAADPRRAAAARRVRPPVLGRAVRRGLVRLRLPDRHPAPQSGSAASSPSSSCSCTRRCCSATACAATTWRARWSSRTAGASTTTFDGSRRSARRSA